MLTLNSLNRILQKKKRRGKEEKVEYRYMYAKNEKKKNGKLKKKKNAIISQLTLSL